MHGWQDQHTPSPALWQPAAISAPSGFQVHGISSVRRYHVGLERKRSLTRSISATADWRELRDLVHDAGPAMNHMHLCAALSALARMAPRHMLARQNSIGSTARDFLSSSASGSKRSGHYSSADAAPPSTSSTRAAPDAAASNAAEADAVRDFACELAERLMLRVHWLEPRGLSGAVHALGRLSAHHAEATAALVEASRGKLGQFGSLDVALMAWGLAQLGQVPDLDWGGRLFDRVGGWSCTRLAGCWS